MTCRVFSIVRFSQPVCQTFNSLALNPFAFNPLAFFLMLVALSLMAPTSFARAANLPVLQYDGAGDFVGAIVATATGEKISPEMLIERLSNADIVALGERHDNRDHHAWQAWITAKLNEARGVSGLAFEMIPRSAEAAAQAHLASGGSVEALEDVLDWEALRWPDWPLYGAIVRAAPNAVLTGGAFDGPELREFATDPMNWSEARRFDLSTALPAAEQSARETEQIAAHCDKLPIEAAPRMVMVQRLWDASFAAAALRAREIARDAKIEGLTVLISGNGHVRKDRGAPAAIANAAPRLRVLAVGMVESDTATDPISSPNDITDLRLYDFVVVTGAPEREDPCAVFEN